jgi:hypothetical protein
MCRRRLRKTKNAPSIGSFSSTVRAIAAVPSMPLRKLIGSCMTTTFAFGGTWITGHLPGRRATRATRGLHRSA